MDAHKPNTVQPWRIASFLLLAFISSYLFWKSGQETPGAKVLNALVKTFSLLIIIVVLVLGLASPLLLAGPFLMLPFFRRLGACLLVGFILVYLLQIPPHLLGWKFTLQTHPKFYCWVWSLICIAGMVFVPSKDFE